MSEEHGTYKVEGRTEVRREARLPFGDPRYAAPTSAEFREVTRLLGLTGSEAGRLLGVDGRTIRKWIGGERDVPYSAWRLLLLEAGLALPMGPAGEEVRMVADRGNVSDA